MKRLIKSESGLTLVEVMVVLVLIGLTAALVVPRGLQQATNAAALDTEAQKLAVNLRLARQMAITNGVASVVYGVRFTHAGSGYQNNYDLVAVSGGTIPLKTEQVDNHVTILSVSTNPITFGQTGQAASAANVVLQEANGTVRKTVYVNSLGTVNIQ